MELRLEVRIQVSYKANKTNQLKKITFELVLLNMQPHPLQPDPPLSTKGGEFLQDLFV